MKRKVFWDWCNNRKQSAMKPYHSNLSSYQQELPKQKRRNDPHYFVEIFGSKTINLISRHLNLFTRYSDTTSTPAAVGPRRQPIGGFTFRIKNVTENQNSNTVVSTNFMTYKDVGKLEQIIFFFVTTNIFSLLVCEILHLDEAFGF